jgi:hypothetical protein
MSALNSMAGRGMYKQLRLIANDLQNPAMADGASAALGELEKQLTLFEELPYEKELARADAPMVAIIGAHRAGISRQITLLRSQWAAAWATGADPSLAGKNLLLVRQLLISLHDNGELQGADAALEQLNRWAAWEMPAKVIDPLRAWQPQRLRLACEQAATAQWAQLALAMDEINRQDPALRLIAQLNSQLGPALRDLPGGVSGMLGQCLYGPNRDSFGDAQRIQLARLCLYMAAGEYAADHDDDATAQQLIQYCGEVAGQILRIWQGANPTVRPGNPLPIDRGGATPPAAIDL